MSREADRHRLVRRGLALEYATLGWNVVGVVVVGIAALDAHSVALAGFGLDSLIEVFASVVVVWELTDAGEAREQRALRFIGLAFFALAVYIVAQAGVLLLSGSRPHRSPLGIGWLAVTVFAMLTLAWGKRVTGAELGNVVLRKEGVVTLIDAALAASVLTGLVLNALAGWWWADPLAGLVIVYYGLREGCGAGPTEPH